MDCSSTQGWISYMYVDVCEYICSRMIREYWVCFGVYVHVCVCASILDVLALFTSCSRYHGFPLHVVGLCRVSWTKPIFSIHSISVHQYWGSHCRCGKLYLYYTTSMFWTIMNFILKMFNILTLKSLWFIHFVVGLSQFFYLVKS